MYSDSSDIWRLNPKLETFSHVRRLNIKFELAVMKLG